ncbi:MAG: class II aldolase/adducin family protein [Xanthobacteraceae bacterium]|nr:class II aldolase/adducin family protein [Xanthobacteraceae bacterium]
MRKRPVTVSLADVRHELAIANRMVAHEGVLDAFGHISVRHPEDPNRYFLSRSRSPELVEPADLYEYDLDSEPVTPPPLPMYSERVIHGEIFKARPDVNAVCHHHSPDILPYCITGEPLAVVYHLGAVIGAHVPFWDSQDEFGDTNLLVRKPEEGASLARTLGDHNMVLMRRHGATVVGGNLRQVVFRTIYGCRNAEYQTAAKLIGKVGTLTPGEVEMAGQLHAQPNTIARAWEYWLTRLEKAGGMPPRERVAPARKAAPARKPAAKAQPTKSKQTKSKPTKGKRR